MVEFRKALSRFQQPLPCKFIAEGNYSIRRALGGKARLQFGALSALAAGVLAIAANFHHVRFFGLFTILAAILAIFFRRAVARWMCAFVFCVFSHKLPCFLFWFVLEVHPKTRELPWSRTKCVCDLRSLAQQDRALSVSQFHHHRFLQLDRVLLAVHAYYQIQTGATRGCARSGYHKWSDFRN